MKSRGITLISLVITIIIILILAGIAISSLTGSGLFEKTEQAKKTYIEAEMREALNLAISELQIEKESLSVIEHITQEWIDGNKKLKEEYGAQVKDKTVGEKQEKRITLTKNGITREYRINEDLSIDEIDVSGIVIPEIKISNITINTENSTNVKESTSEYSLEKVTPVYINFNILTEDIKYKIKYNNEEITMPYQVNTNDKYTFIVEGEYQGHTLVSKRIEVEVKQYKAPEKAVAYDAGIWTQEEITQLTNLKLYDYNETHTSNNIFKLKDEIGLDFTFGGFKVGDSRNKSIVNISGITKYDGWQILESEVRNGKTYVIKITHSGTPEHVVCPSIKEKDSGYRAEYLLSSGLRQTEYSKLSDNTPINPRNWDMYKDKNQLNLIEDVHIMTYNEAYAITGSNTTHGIRSTGARYWLASSGAYNNNDFLFFVFPDGSICDGYVGVMGVRPVVTMKEGVYIVAGDGTGKNPYILAKE